MFTPVSPNDVFAAVSWGVRCGEETDRYVRLLERRWQESLERPTLRRLIELYPSARPAAKRATQARIKEVKGALASISTFRDAIQKDLQTTPYLKRKALKDWANDFETRFLARCEEMLKRLNFDLLFLKSKATEDAVVPQDRITDAMIEHAKATPIADFVQVNHARKAICLWHDDRSPSLHVYRDHAYCFVCNKAVDVIDVYQKLKGCDFKEAVKALAA